MKATLVLSILILCTQLVSINTQSITEYITINSLRYATIDNYPVNTGSGTVRPCDSTSFMTLPTGWSIAANDENSKIAIWASTWGTFALVLADGTAWQTSQDKLSVSTDELLTDSTGKYNVRWCDKRILISSPAGASDTPFIVSLSSVNNFITVNGFDYASIDNTMPETTTIGCQTQPAIIPSGWTIAADTSATKVAFMGPRNTFGTLCLILAGGNSYYNDLTPCLTNTIVKFVMTGGVELIKPASCSQRILISRPSTLPNSWNLSPSISNTFTSGTALYAVMDNAMVTDGSSTCQDRALTLPKEWQIASLSSANLQAALTGTWFGSSCLVLSDGSAWTHTSQTCGTGQLLSVTDGANTYYAVKQCSRKIMITKGNVGAANYTIGLKIGVLTATGNSSYEATYGPIVEVLDGYGANYDKIIVTSSTTLNFLDANGLPKYYALVLTNQHLYSDLSQVGMTAAQDQYIKEYKRKYNVRLFSAFSYPNAPEYNVSLPSDGTALDTYLQLDTAGKPLANGMNPNSVFFLSNIFHYPATIPAGATHIKPVFRFTSTTAAPTSASPLAGGIWTMPDMTEEMHFLFDSASWTLHGKVIASVWINWVTRGIMLGHRRVYLSTQIDDVFLSTEVWDGHPEGNGPAMRMSGAEFPFLTSYMNTLNTVRLPPTSNFKIELGFNGVEAAADTMYANARAYRDKFFWVSHTWSHLDLTCPESNCTIYGATTYNQAFSEMKLNIDFVNTKLFSDKNFASYSSKSMITPKISGLFNANSLKAIRDNGVICAVGDNTRTDLQAANWYQGFYTQYSNIFVIPRFATRIGFDNAYPNHTISQQMYMYGPNGTVLHYYNHTVTLEELLIAERERVLPELVSYRHDPYMFHQANLILYTSNGKTASLLTSWIDYVLDYYVKYSTLPVRTLKEDDLYQNYMKRRATDNCGVTASLTVANCKATKISLQSLNTCEVALTGVKSAGLTYEKYGPDDNTFVPMAANTKEVVLDTPANFC